MSTEEGPEKTFTYYLSIYFKKLYANRKGVMHMQRNKLECLAYGLKQILELLAVMTLLFGVPVCIIMDWCRL